MACATLTIDLSAVAANWRALNALSRTETGAVVKAQAYGLDAARVGETLAKAGARQFFVAVAEEGVALRRAIGPGPAIHVFSGHMDGDTPLIRNNQLTPIVNSVDQLLRHIEALGNAPFGVQLDTGMNRLGMEPAEWAALRDIALRQKPVLLMSHLACADDPAHPMNLAQRDQFHQMTNGVGVPRSLAATGGILLHPDYHFDLTRPGIGLYGGAPYAQAQNVVTLDIPVVQIRDLEPGETVGYANAWSAKRPSRIATISAGYADGLIRSMGQGVHVFVGDIACPVVGRVSMDLITVDVTDLGHDPDEVQLIGPHQGIDAVADAAGTIGYEILTSLGSRYNRAYVT